MPDENCEFLAARRTSNFMKTSFNGRLRVGNRAKADEAVKVVSSKLLHRNQVRGQKHVEIGLVDLLGLLNPAKVDAGRVAADETVAQMRAQATTERQIARQVALNQEIQRDEAEVQRLRAVLDGNAE